VPHHPTGYPWRGAGVDEVDRQKDAFVPIPIIVYVSPSGARAASAGVFITMAANVAVMAPGTHIGAAHPVSLGGGEGKENKAMTEKIVNDTVSNIKSIAKQEEGMWIGLKRQ
jgi:membrane-bound ClpP family serine protease